MKRREDGAHRSCDAKLAAAQRRRSNNGLLDNGTLRRRLSLRFTGISRVFTRISSGFPRSPLNRNSKSNTQASAHFPPARPIFHHAPRVPRNNFTPAVVQTGIFYAMPVIFKRASV
jgi:hypothetical protein